ncbi:hypothetical protein CRE_21800 [Caenorhabditis remanei]|uniref:Uncharacterized protein n=1 Tax=Caenorhabditis remanei TaxID=31234 RepID=E3MEJ5_CAERE|nr:hypothetical protein CRE_21800 [Caenorhabditis remanei]
MLLRLSILAALLFVLSVHSTAIVKRQSSDTQTSISAFNDARKKFAEEGQIANMNELSYDADLESKAKAMANCELKPGSDYAVVAATSDQALTAASSLPAFYPPQTKIGCAKMSKSCVENGITLEGVCLVGPYSQASESGIKTGAPGSQCPNGKTSSGLCRGSPASEVDEIITNESSLDKTHVGVNTENAEKELDKTEMTNEGGKKHLNLTYILIAFFSIFALF